MSLYLCVFDSDKDICGVDVGHYSDFGAFRNAICKLLENGIEGSKFPVLMLHSDCDGEWSVNDCINLEKELTEIASAFAQMPPQPFQSEWQLDTAKLLGIKPTNLNESFIDVDGEPLILRLITLCKFAQQHDLPITFQ